MKSFLAVGLFALMLGLTGVAGAVTYTDVHDGGGVLLTSKHGGTHSVTWEFNILDDKYNPNTQHIISASIKLKLRDDKNDPFYMPFEVAHLSVGENCFVWEVSNGREKFTISGVVSLSDTGKLSVTLAALLGDFRFDWAKLTAEATAPVPEPSTVMLFGSGLLAFGVWRKTR